MKGFEVRCRRPVCGLTLLAVAACGAGCASRGLGGSGTLEGDGAFAVKAAYFEVNEFPGDTEHRFGASHVLRISLLPDPLTCDTWSADGGAEAERIGIFLSQGPAISTGTYPFHDDPSPYAVDSAGVFTADRLLAGGELRLDLLSQDAAEGSFDAFDGLQDGGTVQLSGTFHAVRCATPSGE